MQKLKRIMRVGALYIAAIMLVISPSTMAQAKEDETYYYDQSSGRWNSSKWTYDAATNTYLPAVPSPKPSPTPAPEQSTDNTKKDEASTKKDTSADSSAAVAGTGPSSNNQVKDTTNASSTTDVKSKTTIDNTENSDATTGNAGVKQNTKAGDAKTGNASVDTTIINSVHSTVGTDENAGIARFTIDYYGDVNGDIVIGPNMGNTQVDKTTNINSKTNIDNDDAITNNINLNAQSGNADVSGNTIAGSAQSGDARAVANLLNLVNTVIAANQSFVGTINIHGNLNGNILLSPEFIPQLLASNANNVIETEFNMPLSTNINDDRTIVNNIDLKATSGTATVKDNTAAGNAQSGEAQTKLQILNLTGHEVIADDALLVFVNVGGKWVGMIVDAPGATAAAFGSGVSSHKVNAASATNINNKTAITNNINVAAATGDASVSSNTSGGDAKTGDAFAGANIANISNSTFDILNSIRWLFINIAKDWNGDLKPYELNDPDVITAMEVLASSDAPQPVVGSPNVKLGFVPRVQNELVKTVTTASAASNVSDPYVGAVLASAATKAPAAQLAATPSAGPRDTTSEMVMMGVGLAIAFAGTTLATGKSGFFTRRNR